MREPRWHRLAIRDLEKLHWRTAANIDAAIQEFASTGAGVLRKIDVDGHTELRLYIAPFFAWILTANPNPSRGHESAVTRHAVRSDRVATRRTGEERRSAKGSAVQAGPQQFTDRILWASLRFGTKCRLIWRAWARRCRLVSYIVQMFDIETTAIVGACERLQAVDHDPFGLTEDYASCLGEEASSGTLWVEVNARARILNLRPVIVEKALEGDRLIYTMYFDDGGQLWVGGTLVTPLLVTGAHDGLMAPHCAATRRATTEELHAEFPASFDEDGCEINLEVFFTSFE